MSCVGRCERHTTFAAIRSAILIILDLHCWDQICRFLTECEKESSDPYASVSCFHAIFWQ